MKNFWTSLKKPILIQAPMEDVTDTVFRQIIARCGKPDVFFTEFTNVEGMCSKGRDKVGKRLKFTDIEHPIVAQIWGNNPKNYFETAKLIRLRGFDGIDINMGCPEKSVVKKGSCAALINNHALAKEIILATREGASGLPVSVKTRIGIKNIQTEKWARFLLGLNLDCLIIHGRTAAEMSDVPAHWDEIGKVVKLRDAMKVKTLIIGNGDVKSLDDAMEKYKRYKVDGIMIGRGIFDNLWIYNKSINPASISYQEKLKLLITHITLFDKTWGKTKNFSIMKKFYKIYISGPLRQSFSEASMPNASNVRTELMKFQNAKETLEFLKTKN
ncbi:MAG: tRNA-dihydrouridine synthase [Candidatus Levybacteria bacterium]|nr:tRNA-dihydrouridine synthase [Candidatus Levybacteria bacterium]